MLAVEIPLATEADVASIPTITEHYSQHVLSAAEKIRNVVGLILQALVVAGPSGSKDLVADALTIQMHLVQAVAGDISARLLHRTINLERAAQQGRRLRPRTSSCRSG